MSRIRFDDREAAARHMRERRAFAAARRRKAFRDAMVAVHRNVSALELAELYEHHRLTNEGTTQGGTDQ